MVCLIQGARFHRHDSKTYQPSPVGVLNGQTRVRHGHEPAILRSQRVRLLFTPSVHKVQIQVGSGVVGGIPHAVGIYLRIRPWHDMTSNSRGEQSLDKSAPS